MSLHYFVCLFIVGLYLLINACEKTPSKTYERIEHFENGQVSRRFNIVKDKKEGKMTDYYPNGELKAERYFVNDEQHGRTVIYYPGGQINEVQYYEMGKKQGGDTIWYEDGKIQFVTTLKDGKKNGYLRKWSPEGTLVYEAKYSLDTLMEVKGQPVDRNNESAKPSVILKKQE